MIQKTCKEKKCCQYTLPFVKGILHRGQKGKAGGICYSKKWHSFVFCFFITTDISHNVIHMSDLYFAGKDDGASNREEIPQLDP